MARKNKHTTTDNPTYRVITVVVCLFFLAIFIYHLSFHHQSDSQEYLRGLGD